MTEVLDVNGSNRERIRRVSRVVNSTCKVFWHLFHVDGPMLRRHWYAMLSGILKQPSVVLSSATFGARRFYLSQVRASTELLASAEQRMVTAQSPLKYIWMRRWNAQPGNTSASTESTPSAAAPSVKGVAKNWTEFVGGARVDAVGGAMRWWAVRSRFEGHQLSSGPRRLWCNCSRIQRFTVVSSANFGDTNNSSEQYFIGLCGI